MSQTDVQDEFKNLVDTVSPKVETAALVAAERGAQFAEIAAERGAQFAEIAAERGSAWADRLAERSNQAAERLADRIPDDVVDRLPDALAERLPRKSRKGRKALLVLGGVAAAGAVAYVVRQRRPQPQRPTGVPAEQDNAAGPRP